ncbi:putative RNA uridine N3 methyltransferase [Staphylothermus hellenicus]|uniref:RNA-binding protein n=1 Tax=Staphylothermus hellenicus (strain DSM 12710 / JCM 10830 / BK20S6-10-b1 / P8) TaxID=591019 RepID=D7D9U0_STAHD|nr:RNA methyltransferase [Staphylothermus hellenicus]ADI32536.1 Protein of unknown function DUF171 [Staphylothermus hellenicus DSM 12710]
MKISRKILVALPTSILSTESSLLLKTMKIYQVIRYSSIFGVLEIVFFRDPFTDFSQHNKYSALIEKIWRYLLTPPYLRRKLIPKDPDLKFVGLLPPLRLNIFDVSRNGYVGEKRLGFIYKEKNKLLADIGLLKPYRIEAGNCEPGDIGYVEIVDMNTRRAICLDEEPYRGPVLAFADSLREVLEEYGRIVDLIIATSRYGRIPNYKELAGVKGKTTIILFGGPHRGLYEIAEKEGFALENKVDKVWNTIPEQMVKTIRSEEALISTLAVINMFIYGENL